MAYDIYRHLIALPRGEGKVYLAWRVFSEDNPHLTIATAVVGMVRGIICMCLRMSCHKAYTKYVQAGLFGNGKSYRRHLAG
ncbi:MAG: hypothetical protein ACLFQ6_06990 [Candidatus Sumerlaeia bacterium]